MIRVESGPFLNEATSGRVFHCDRPLSRTLTDLLDQFFERNDVDHDKCRAVILQPEGPPTFEMVDW